MAPPITETVNTYNVVPTTGSNSGMTTLAAANSYEDFVNVTSISAGGTPFAVSQFNYDDTTGTINSAGVTKAQGLQARLSNTGNQFSITSTDGTVVYAREQTNSGASSQNVHLSISAGPIGSLNVSMIVNFLKMNTDGSFSPTTAQDLVASAANNIRTAITTSSGSLQTLVKDATGQTYKVAFYALLPHQTDQQLPMIIPMNYDTTTGYVNSSIINGGLTFTV